ncbi:MAG TPA: hypothetical protein VM223_20045 [Planctomycetota bacterium]|nr:hypothetical protein [Planctomycetota bacterium]HUW33906.1 hypothetical protein [Planctomycetota bacterium]
MHADVRVKGRLVEFSLGDLLARERLRFMQHATGDLELKGRVLDYVEIGDPPEAFVVMEVRGVKTPMLVPVSALQS